MNVTKDFIAGPATFLEKYVVQVADVTQMNAAKRVDLREFIFFQIKDTTVVALRYAKDEKDGDKVKAYWLPWLDKQVVTMDVGDDANYFFTSQMTDCRFTVMTKDGKKPKVGHLAGTMSITARNKAEETMAAEMGGGDVRSRRLSTRGAKDHGYTGQNGKVEDRTSAFVYGVRDKASGVWTFESQIVKAVMVESFNPKVQGTPEIKKPFKF